MDIVTNSLVSIAYHSLVSKVNSIVHGQGFPVTERFDAQQMGEVS